jgi:hypothetical protein
MHEQRLLSKITTAVSIYLFMYVSVGRVGFEVDKLIREALALTGVASECHNEFFIQLKEMLDSMDLLVLIVS